MTLQVLIQEKGTNIKYSDLLKTDEWKARRIPILNRDGRKCTKCQAQGTETFWAGYGYKHGYWLPTPTMQLKNEFFEMFDYYERTLGDQFQGLASRKEDFELVIDYENEMLITVEKPVYLQVHHHHYIKGRYPWEYPDEDLVTLCVECHQDFHLHNKVPYYDLKSEKSVLIEELSPCCKCAGSGYLPQYEYVQNGVCFDCKGTGGYERLVQGMVR